MLNIAIAALAIIGAGIVLEAFAEIARLRRLARAERASWLTEAPEASQLSLDSQQPHRGIGV